MLCPVSSSQLLENYTVSWQLLSVKAKGKISSLFMIEKIRAGLKSFKVRICLSFSGRTF